MVAKRASTDKPKHLGDMLRYAADRHPKKVACAYLGEDGNIRAELDFATLDCKARALAARLVGLGARNECAVLLYPPGLEFVISFFACMYAGVIAIPLPVPRTKPNLVQTQGIIDDTNSQLILSTQTTFSKLTNQHASYFDKLICLDTENTDIDLAAIWQSLASDSIDGIAYLQYTSGSTSARKGVMISHRNVIENIEGIDRGFRHDENSVAINWLPHFHDLGLVSGILQPLYHGVSNYLMAPSALVQRPIRWLEAISRFRGTHTNSPNYAYELCVKKITSEQKLSLDLSCWQVALNGAEPVRAQTIRDFYLAFKACGLAKTTMYPAYGLAEATLVVTAGLANREPQILAVDINELENGRINPVKDLTDARELVACGQPLEDTVVCIVNPDTQSEVAANEVGEIWVSGPAVASGYWQSPEQSVETFGAVLGGRPERTFLRTGDLGFMFDGQLYITGRQKDLIIIRGSNHYPQDIEWTVENSSKAFKAGCGAAFSIDDDGAEKLIVVYEVEREYIKQLDLDTLVKAARSSIAQEHDLQLHGLVLLKTATVPRTSSGKIQRRQCQREFLENNLAALATWLASDPESEVYQPAAQMGDANLPPITNLKVANLETGTSISPHKIASVQEMLSWLRKYAGSRINSQSYDERRVISPNIILDFGNAGVLGLQAAREYGGLGYSTSEAIQVIQQLGAIDQTLAMMCIVHNTLGILPIERSAKRELKESLLPFLASGRELVAFALTEPTAGSNPRVIAAQARKINANQWQISGQKSWSGTAGWASTINVFAQNIEQNGEPNGMVGFAVPLESRGLKIGAEAKTFGMRGMVQNTILLDDVLVDESQLLGASGEGMQVAQYAMQRGRLMIAAACVGGMKRCVQLMIRYAERRTISTGKLLNNGFWLHRMEEINAQIYALDSLIREVAHLEDSNAVVPADIFAVLKITAPEYFWCAADSLMQMLGGRGYIETNVAPQLLRDARVARILEGPTEALQMYLGARVAKDSNEYCDFLLNQLGGAAIWQRISPVIKDEGLIRPVRELTLCRFGQLAAVAILSAAVESNLQNHPSTRAHSSCEWARKTLDRQISELAVNRQTNNQQDTATLLEAGNSYMVDIGDVEQTLPGFDEQMDPMLQKATSVVPSTHLSTSTVATTQSPAKTESNDVKANLEESRVATFITEWLDKEFKFKPGTVKATDTFFEHGVDSVVSVMLTVAVEDAFSVDLEPEIIYDHQRIDRCAKAIAERTNMQT